MLKQNKLMKENNIRIENYAPQFFDIGQVKISLNTRDILAIFYEEPQAFCIKYFEIKKLGELKELGGSIGPTKNDAFLSLDNTIRHTVIKNLRDKEIFSVK